jgi:hypothetical protein
LKKSKVSTNSVIMTSVFWTPFQRERLKKIGRQRGISAAEALRRILDAGLLQAPAPEAAATQ